MIQDFEQMGTDEQAQKMAAGLRLSAHALAGNPRQLPSQLLGRIAADDGPEIATLLTGACERAAGPALLPLRATLTPPGTALTRIVTGHSGVVLAVAALAERGAALSAGWDGTVRLWDLDSGREVRRFEGHSGGVLAVAALAERGAALSAGDDGTVRLWDLASGEQLAVFTGDASFRCCAVTPDGRFAIAGHRGGQVQVLDIVV